MTKRCFVGLLGCGVVGSGVVQALASCRDTVLQRFGVDIEVVQIAVRHLERPRPAQVRREWLCDNWRDVVGNPRIDVVIEVMGGLHPAYEAVKTALSSGKSVITANKELLAMHGAELARIAQENRVTLLSEASVLGGVPVLHALQHYFSANRITKLTAIANGTSNYILTRMRLAGVSFPEALAEAQAAGYAEADPSFDVLGLDARSKLQILCQAAFHAHLDGQSIACEGIAHLDAGDLAIAETLGCRIRHVALAEPTLDGIRASVRPMLIPEHHPLFGIDGVNNALCIDADLVGQLVYAGPGAGGAATASAVVEDLVQLLTGGAGESQGALRPAAAVPAVFPAYLIWRRWTGRHQLGPNGLPMDGGVVPTVDYLPLPALNVECWVVRADFPLEPGIVDGLLDTDGEPMRCLPFLEIPRNGAGVFSAVEVADAEARMRAD